MYKKNMKKIVNLFIAGVMIISLFACSNAYKKLIPYTFNDKTVAAVITSTPWGNVSTNSYFTISTGTSKKSSSEDILSTVLNVATTVINSVEASKAQAKMDSAMKHVDVSKIIKTQTLNQGSAILHFNPIDDTHTADFLFSITINSYGISANSWASSVNFNMDVTLKIYDNHTSELIWKTGVSESDPVSSAFFFGNTAAGNVLTALQLSQLSQDQMKAGFQHMAEYAANKLVEKLQKDYSKSRNQ
ncbi:MAG: hypothetical protein JW794_00895 [Candidatus Cloacimonetes bacterium]|nr:hypothetical protein [Candidatus Cloacimonadota bacterium]